MAIPETAQVGSRSKGRYPTGFPIRCTEAEKQEIFARAERANRSASRFLVERAVAVSEHGIDVRRLHDERELLEGLTVQLRRLASNLHELADREHASAADDSDAPSPAELDEAVLEVRAMLDQLRSRLA
jgi:hypothetical protein